MSYKNPLTSPSRDATPKNVQTQKCPDFSIEPRRLSAYLDGLNSSLALSVDKLWLEKVRGTNVALRCLRGDKAPCAIFVCSLISTFLCLQLSILGL